MDLSKNKQFKSLLIFIFQFFVVVVLQQSWFASESPRNQMFWTRKQGHLASLFRTVFLFQTVSLLHMVSLFVVGGKRLKALTYLLTKTTIRPTAGQPKPGGGAIGSVLKITMCFTPRLKAFQPPIVYNQGTQETVQISIQTWNTNDSSLNSLLTITFFSAH